MSKPHPPEPEDTEPDLDQVPDPVPDQPGKPDVWTPRRVAGMLAVYVVAAGLGYVAFRAGLPIPWMLGALATATFSRLVFQSKRPPRFARIMGQVVVGSGVGLYLSPDALKLILESALPIVLMSVLTVGAAITMAVIQTRLAGVKLATAIFACIPGSPVEMANMAEINKGDPGQVALAQMLRIVAIVTLFPPLLILSGVKFDPFTKPIAAVDPAGLVAMLVMSVAIGWCGVKLRMINPYFLAPMALTGALTALGVHLSGLPSPLLAFAQLMLGVSTGSMFRRSLFRNHKATTTTLVSTFVLLSASLSIAWLMAHLFDLDIAAMALASAPGSVTEMTLTAKAMHLDVSLIAAFHLFRVFFIMALVPVLFGAAVWIAGGGHKKKRKPRKKK
jgi:membrane AbrB-like protein